MTDDFKTKFFLTIEDNGFYKLGAFEADSSSNYNGVLQID